ncbi:MAG: class B sortase [Bacteroides sp.]|nr:class B sortase [Bacteroides sp.]MCM1550554.1 class B sortase [Clostridium sp.]
MKNDKTVICIVAAVCLLGAVAFCGCHIYEQYAHESEQTEAFEEIADKVEQVQMGEEAPQVPLNEEETILPEYGELFLQKSDMVGWISIAGTKLNYPVMQTPNEPNFYLKHNFEKAYGDLGTPYIQENCNIAESDNTNPYTIRLEETNSQKHYFVAFIDGQAIFREVEVSYEVYIQFCRFIKCERNLRRSDERHRE